MSDKPKRRFWQFHLSTAVVMTLLAGIIIPRILENAAMIDDWRDFNDKGQFNDPIPEFYIIASILAAGLIIGAGCILESLIRRREARRA